MHTCLFSWNVLFFFLAACECLWYSTRPSKTSTLWSCIGNRSTGLADTGILLPQSSPYGSFRDDSYFICHCVNWAVSSLLGCVCRKSVHNGMSFFLPYLIFRSNLRVLNLLSTSSTIVRFRNSLYFLRIPLLNQSWKFFGNLTFAQSILLHFSH